MPHREKPRVHARDHEHGGADPQRIHYEDVGGSGDGAAALVIADEGTPLPARGTLDFVGDGVTATDDSGSDSTIVTIPGGGDGGGIQYDTDNEGGWLDVGVADSIPGTHSHSRFHASSSDSLVVGLEVTAETSAVAGEAIGIQVEAIPGTPGTAVALAAIADTGYAIQAETINGTALHAHASGSGTGITISVSTGVALYVVAAGSIIFRIDPDGSLHGKTGKSLTFDL